MRWFVPQLHALRPSDRQVIRRLATAICCIAGGFLVAALALVLASNSLPEPWRQVAQVASLTGAVAIALVVALKIILGVVARNLIDVRDAYAAGEHARLEGVKLAANTMQHHINNSLALTVGYGELLSEQPELSHSTRDMASEALRGARDAASVLTRLSDVDRLVEAVGLRTQGGGVIDLKRSTPDRKN
jgi:hypothetical protein